VLEVSKRWLDRGHEVHLFATTVDGDADPRIRFHRIPTFSKIFLLRETIISLMATIMLMFQKFDVTLAQPTRYFSPDVGEIQFVYREWANYKRRTGVKDKLWVRLADKGLSWIEKRNVKKAKALIAIANCVKDELLKNYDIPAGKIHVIHSGVNPQEFGPENRRLYRADVRKKFGVSENETLLLFVGNPFLRKGLDALLQALAQIDRKDVKLLVSGKDDPEPYKRKAAELGIADKVVFNIGLTREINKIYSAADAFVFPTRYEPFGLVITEAMASGLPVITSRLAGAAEVIDNVSEGYLLDDPMDVQELTTRLNQLLARRSEWPEMGARCRRKAEQYSWDGVAGRMLDILKDVAEAKRSQT